MKFPKTLAAVKNADQNETKDQWAIGEALIEECGAPSENGVRDKGYFLLQEAAKILAEKGYSYQVSSLANIRFTAYMFSPSTRRAGIAFNTHRIAGSPDYLAAIIAGAPKGTVITQPYIQAIRNTQLEKAKRERQRRADKAREAREKAEAVLEKAHHRKASQNEIKKLSEEAWKAQEHEEKVRVAPTPALTPPEPAEVSRLVVETQFLANAARSVVLARQAVNDLKNCLDQLSATGIYAMTEAALEAANAWTEAANLVRSQVTEQRGHLSVVGE